jgi:hypothetical protein
LIESYQDPTALSHQRQEFGVESPAIEEIPMALEPNSISLKHRGNVVVI